MSPDHNTQKPPAKHKENASEHKPPAKKESKPSKKPTPKPASNTKSDVTVKFGKPFMQVTFKRIKSYVTIFVLLFVVVVLLSVNLLITSIRIRSHLGSFINMISSGDGEVLPTFLALPVFVFLCVNVALFFFVYKIFAKVKNSGANNILFILIAAALVMLLVTLVVIVAALGHVYGANKQIEDGIIRAMEKYGINSFYKKQIDRLQIEFQCCGSKKYDDWFNISWVDEGSNTSLKRSVDEGAATNLSDAKANSTNSTNSTKSPNSTNSPNTTKSPNSASFQTGSTPFSCCAIKTKFPCIHFDIETIGSNYLYTPEFNLSISVIGCHQRIVEKKQQVGLGIVASLFLYIFLEILMLIPARFLQTGHSIDYKFEGNSKTYIVWLLGSYSGKNKANGPPEPPPVPPDLMN